MLYVGSSVFLSPGWARGLRYLELPGREHFEPYAREFNAGELTLPNYLPSQPALAVSLLRRCRPGFLFTVKTHPEITRHCPGDEAVFAAFRQAVKPLQQEHRLGCVLAPLPAYFEYNQRHRDYLLLLRERLEGAPLAVEFHNPSWFRRDALDWLHWQRLSLCWREGTPVPPTLPLRATAGMAYIRIQTDIPGPTSPAGDALRLSRCLPRIRELAAQSEKTFVFVISSLQGQGLGFLRKLKMVLEGSSLARTEGTGLLPTGGGGARR